MDELECSQSGGTEQRLLVRECVGLLRILARGELMMIVNIPERGINFFAYSLRIFHDLTKRNGDK